MNYAEIIKGDFTSGKGIRTSLFISGCTKHCVGCFNQEAQDFSYGLLFNDEIKKDILNSMDSPLIDGLSILGGDPLDQDEEGLRVLMRLITEVKSKNKTVWLWSGFVWEDIFSTNTTICNYSLVRSIVKLCDVFIDGPFIQEQKDLSLAFRGSKNQRIIDVQDSSENHVVLLKQYDN